MIMGWALLLSLAVVLIADSGAIETGESGPLETIDLDLEGLLASHDPKHARPKPEMDLEARLGPILPWEGEVQDDPHSPCGVRCRRDVASALCYFIQNDNSCADYKHETQHHYYWQPR